MFEDRHMMGVDLLGAIGARLLLLVSAG